MKHIYVSCPISVPEARFNVIIESINTSLEESDPNEEIMLEFWDRDSKYDPAMLKRADAVIFVLPNNGWYYDISSLPVGVKAELKEAIRTDKKIFLFYRNSHTGDAIYETSWYAGEIRGVSGTSHLFSQFCKELAKADPEEVSISKTYRYKTEEEFKAEDRWDFEINAPIGWNTQGLMNKYLGKPLTEVEVERYLSTGTNAKFLTEAYISKEYHGMHWKMHVRDVTSKPLPVVQKKVEINIPVEEHSITNHCEEIFIDSIVIDRKLLLLLR